VLKQLLTDDRHEVVALSGTSGGAVCAFLAWQGLSRDDPSRAVELLDAFWAETAATAPWDVALNNSVVAAARMEGTVALPALSPYLYPPWAQGRFRRQLERLVPARETEQNGSATLEPLLLVGAVDVLSGGFKAFSSARNEITIEAILASAAVPSLFRAVPVEGDLYWDGLFSQNPPVRELPDAGPDEIWVVRINPLARSSEPTTIADISDRRNELAGNLSLEQELYFIDRINRFVGDGSLSGTKHRKIGVEIITIDRDLDYASKLDRTPSFLDALAAHGEEQAAAFLARTYSSA
jgi:NTE family protein